MKAKSQWLGILSSSIFLVGSLVQATPAAETPRATVACLSTRNGVVLGTGGYVQTQVTFQTFLSSSHDGGKTWHRHIGSFKGGVEVVQFLNSKHGFAAGEEMEGGGHSPFVLFTANGSK